ncbi:multidrug efflux pump subunit AcrA (membrane-fusion protein) [Pedobacter sp. UYP30]|uniref:HlyD family efflux transporter periplasmic adaptor subunit n=1 Tax=Pedobacter sp. UYP30 TaxID=1756400 RepID=UPI00339A0BB6
MKTEQNEEILSTLDGHEINSEEVQDIITAVPSWILRWGITIVFSILLIIVMISRLIRYPDVIKTGLKVNSLNAPKGVFSKESGKLVTILAKEGEVVRKGQSLAFIESTATHNDVLMLRDSLEEMNRSLIDHKKLHSLKLVGLNLGELQSDYQQFVVVYLEYTATENDGYFIGQRNFLEKDLKQLEILRRQIRIQQQIREQEFRNVEEQFKAYKKLYQKGIISRNEFRQQENSYLSGKYPLLESTTVLLDNGNASAQKNKDILDLKHTIAEVRAKFRQSLSNMLSQIKAWQAKYVLTAPLAGKLSYAGVIQENQTILANQEVFVVNPSNLNFFGEVLIPQYNMGRVNVGQKVLVKMQSFPYEQYGLIRGEISYISDVAFHDSVFVAKVNFEKFENRDTAHRIVLKNGMLASAEIITEESSLLERFLRNFTKMLNSN